MHFPHVTTITTLPSVIPQGGVWGGWGVRLLMPTCGGGREVVSDGPFGSRKHFSELV